MADITMSLDDTLELDTIIKEINSSSGVATITDGTEGTDYNLGIIQSQTEVFDPINSGTYNIDINGQTLTVDVKNTGIPKTESNQKLEHRYLLDSIGDGTIDDSIGSADGTNSGVASVSGLWANSNAGVWDGSSSYINIGTLGDYGSKIPDGAIAFSIEYKSSSDSHILGTDVGQNLQLAVGHDTASTGQIYLDLKDAEGNRNKLHSSETVDDGSKYRVVVNFPGQDATNHEFWFNQTQGTTSVNTNQPVDMSDFAKNIHLFAKNGGPNSTDHIIDDICLFNQSLTQSEIESYNNPWS